MATETPSKGMSSRLLTMKFMQRAAASSSPTSTSSTPQTDGQSSKRRKVDHTPSAKVEVESLVDQQAVQAAIDEGERKREEALVKHAAELGDARWILNVHSNMVNSGTEVQKPLNVVQVGFAQIDYPDTLEDHSGSTEDSHDRAQPIRRYNMGKKKAATEASDSSGDSSTDTGSSDTDSSADADEDGRASRTPSGKQGSNTSRNGHQGRKSTEKAKAKEFAEKRRRKEVRLNTARPQSYAGGLPSLSSGGGLSSLSSGGRSSKPQPKQQSGAFSFKCHNCGETGHKVANCKKPKQRNR